MRLENNFEPGIVASGSVASYRYGMSLLTIYATDARHIPVISDATTLGDSLMTWSGTVIVLLWYLCDLSSDITVFQTVLGALMVTRRLGSCIYGS